MSMSQILTRILLACPHCKATFRERAKYIRGGATLQCQGCKAEILFSDDSPHDVVRKGLAAARRARLVENTNAY
jgi:hypothetical protein